MTDSLETFSGKKNFTKAKRKAGLKACSFEYDDDNIQQNILTDIGFINLLYMALVCREGGQSVNGIPFWTSCHCC